MRITLDLPAPFYRKVQKLARQRKTTFQALMIEALSRYLTSEEEPGPSFRLPDRSFKGDGLVGGLSAMDWVRIRDLFYGGCAHEGVRRQPNRS